MLDTQKDWLAFFIGDGDVENTEDQENEEDTINSCMPACINRQSWYGRATRMREIRMPRRILN